MIAELTNDIVHSLKTLITSVLTRKAALAKEANEDESNLENYYNSVK